MSYVRMTNDMRDKVVERLIIYRFTAEVGTIADWQAQLAADVYQDAFLKLEHEIMAGIPQGWLPSQSNIRFQVGGLSQDQYVVPFNGRQFEKGNLYSLCAPRENIYKPFPNCRSSGAIKIFEEESKVGQSYRKLVDTKDDLVKRVEDARKQAKVAVNAVTTISALVKNWPEIEPFVRDFAAGEPVLNVPMLPVPKLNAIFDLPATQSVEIAQPKEIA